MVARWAGSGHSLRIAFSNGWEDYYECSPDSCRVLSNFLAFALSKVPLISDCIPARLGRVPGLLGKCPVLRECPEQRLDGPSPGAEVSRPSNQVPNPADQVLGTNMRSQS